LKIIPLDSTHFYQSNSMNRGIQTFTSFISTETQFIFLNEHLNRLIKGADYLFPKMEWSSKLEEIKSFLATEYVPSHYFRLCISEDYLLFSKKPHIPKQPFVTLGNAQSSKVASIIPSFVKNANYLIAELELKAAAMRKCDDVVFFDQHNNVTEASTSNVFVWLDSKTVITPKASSMVLAGVTRERLIAYLKTLGLSVLEADISKSELESSMEIWLTNAIQGLRLVERYEGIDKFSSTPIYQSVCKEFGRFGERFNHE
jgi:branched-subunit amino acid aminotransferase/4-amino-4-deoxychorismate lyase